MKAYMCAAYGIFSRAARRRLAITKATTFQARLPGLHDVWGHLILHAKERTPASVDLRSKYLEKHSGYFG